MFQKIIFKYFEIKNCHENLTLKINVKNIYFDTEFGFLCKPYQIYLFLVVANFYANSRWQNKKTKKQNTKKNDKSDCCAQIFFKIFEEKYLKKYWFFIVTKKFTFFYLPQNCFTHIFRLSAVIPLIFQSNFASSKFISKPSYFTEHLAVKWVTCMVQINVHLILQS